MARRKKIDIKLLITMTEKENKTVSECARFFGVSPAAIYKALKKLDIEIKRYMARSIVIGEILRGLRQKGWL